ncbi:MAG: DUF4145 domain-containing protein [Candidatus Dadabacteria bacterium]|nr:DUF4145 domain-containing protein [Candidatus Dadabacteria bacterium]MDE0662853.1 DUF4145 domain-containing protein [Candidatus Dadabacteria bacterium]
MPSFPHDCPHCGTKQAGFYILSEFHSPLKKGIIYTFVICGISTCQKAATAVFQVNLRDYTYSGSHSELANDFSRFPSKFLFVDFYPKPETPEIPEHLPENVNMYYLEAVNSVKSSPNAAGAMFRKTLDTGLKKIDPEAKGRLIDRIKSAAKTGKITQDMADWADRIRLDGNDAAHEEDPFTHQEAEELHLFTRLVMMYLFSLPGMLEEWKTKTETS